MKKKVMITGVAGFIGSHLAENILKKGFQVYGLDIADPSVDTNMKSFINNPDFKYFQGDIRSEDDLDSFFQFDAEVIYHLASVVGVNRYMEDPMSLIDISIIGTKRLIELCQKNNTRMLFTSTSEVYGRNADIPWLEDGYRVLGPTNVDRWSYSTAKALCEHMLFGVHHQNGWPMSIIRFFNIYGPRQNPIYIISKSIHSIMNGKSPELYDGGKQTRCFTFIDDVIDGIILSGTKNEAIGEIINLGNPIERTMEEAMNIVMEKISSDIEVQKVETTEKYGKVYQDIPRRVPDISKAQNILGWFPKTSLEEGVAKTVEWVKENHWYLK